MSKYTVRNIVHIEKERNDKDGEIVEVEFYTAKLSNDDGETITLRSDKRPDFDVNDDISLVISSKQIKLTAERGVSPVTVVKHAEVEEEDKKKKVAKATA